MPVVGTAAWGAGVEAAACSAENGAGERGGVSELFSGSLRRDVALVGPTMAGDPTFAHQIALNEAWPEL